MRYSWSSTDDWEVCQQIPGEAEAEAEPGVGLGNLEARLGLWNEIAGQFTLAARGPWTTATVQWIPEGAWACAD